MVLITYPFKIIRQCISGIQYFELWLNDKKKTD